MASLVLSRRQTWMAQQLTKSFGVDIDTAEKCIRDNKKKVDAFLLEVDSPPKIFFFYQPRQANLAVRRDKDEQKKELFLSISTLPMFCLRVLFRVCLHYVAFYTSLS